jgi:diguanylate cyclase (GGDEF)-like protein/PAS domain S-box-containing protein
MLPLWNWCLLAALGGFAIWQQIRVFAIHRESAKREELFQIVTENAEDMIALVDVRGNRLYNSPAYRRVLGYSAAELSETSSFDQIHPDDRLKVLEAAQEARRTGVGRKVEYRIRHKDGSWRVLESVAGTIRDEKGDVAKLVIVNRDVTERKRAEAQAEHNSFHDGLTGLPNRSLFLDRLQHLFERAERSPSRQFAVLLVDLDGFTTFNDTMGPAVGDRVIIEMSQRLSACLRDEDTVSPPQDKLATTNPVLSRLAGDEFAILLEGMKAPSDPMRVGQRILSAVATPFMVKNREVRTSASIGITLSTPSHKRAEDLLQEADIAMRRAKAVGGSRCEVYDEAMHSQAVHRLKLETELSEALRKGEFRVCYQPIVDLRNREIRGFEALLRWQHPEHGLISPHKFIDAAEDTGLLFSTGQWLILQACQQMRAWEIEHSTPEPVNMSVNLSPKQLADTRFVSGLQSILRETGIEAARLQLEITETVAATDPNSKLDVLSRLRQLGVGLILDDFGTGNSSLRGLRQFPLDALKIDRELVSQMLADRDASESVELIILLAHKLKLKVIAEGIETTNHLARLCELGCDLGQGYLFSQPVEAEAIGKLLRENTPLRQAKIARA